MFYFCIKHVITIIPAIQSGPDSDRLQLRENEKLRAQVKKLRWDVLKIKGDLAKIKRI